MAWHPLVFLLAVLVSLYDLRSGKVPNWVTLPLLAAGLLARFPGQAETWLASLVLLSFWNQAAGGIAAGDIKLWLAYLWLAQPSQALVSAGVAFGALFLTALAQITWRRLQRRPATGLRAPGAWRILPYAAWLAGWGL